MKFIAPLCRNYHHHFVYFMLTRNQHLAQFSHKLFCDFIKVKNKLIWIVDACKAKIKIKQKSSMTLLKQQIHLIIDFVDGIINCFSLSMNMNGLFSADDLRISRRIFEMCKFRMVCVLYCLAQEIPRFRFKCWEFFNVPPPRNT